LGSIFHENDIMYVNLFFDGLSNGELLTFKTGPPCILYLVRYWKNCDLTANSEMPTIFIQKSAFD